MTFTPKETFAKGPRAKPWSDVASSELFREAAGVALLQMQANQGYAKDGFETQRNNFQLEGARTYLSILMNLTTPPEERPTTVRRDNLDHSV